MSRIYLIAELGSTHDGSIGIAKRSIEVMARCGVDAVKFQDHRWQDVPPDAPRPPWFTDEPRAEYFARTSFSRRQWTELAEVCDRNRVDLVVSPFSAEAALDLDGLARRWKVASGQVANPDLLALLSRSDTPVLLSTGLSTWAEIDQAVAATRLGSRSSDAVLQCTTRYPCPPEAVGPHVIREMTLRYPGVRVGYSDHTREPYAPLLAVALGADVIEVHASLSRDLYGSDAWNSFEPSELASLVRQIRLAEDAMASRVDKSTESSHTRELRRIFCRDQS